jgi:diadenosine tetraphosphate (Ap4A) HIT family hydrolase
MRAGCRAMPAAMNTRPKWIVLFGVLVAARAALGNPPPTDKPKPAKTDSATAEAGSPTPDDRRVLMRQLRDEREKRVREKGEIFARIATKHDYSGEYVLFRDQDVTAFLDLKDPRHPRYKPEHDEEDGPAGKDRSHILVVPNQPRETIGKTVASDITAEDLEVTLKVMRAAAAVASRLGIKNPKIFVKSPARVGVGYLHVHVLGERDPKLPYPPPLR